MIKLIGGGVAAVIVLSLAVSSCQTVDTGHRGVKITFGKVEQKSLPEGLYFVNPFTTNVVEMDTRIKKWSAKTATYTKDIQQADVGFVVTYRLRPDAAHKMYQSVGQDWVNQLLPQVVSSSIKDEFGRWNAVQVVADRTTVADRISGVIGKHVGKRDIILESFEITNIDFSDAFESAVEAKEVAVQTAIGEQNKTKSVEERARQRVISAKAEAESMRIRSAALEANARLVEYEAVQKWDGKLPTYMLGGGAMPFLPVK